MDDIKITKVENVQLEKGPNLYHGTLHLTVHHIIFKHSEEELSIPYPIIHTVERRPLSQQTSLYPLQIKCRDFQFVTLSMSNDKEAAAVYETIQKLTCINSTEQLYAYCKPTITYPTNDGWTIYNPVEEYTRMGVGTQTDSWRFTNINHSYAFSPTYPSTLVVPAKISNNVLNYAAKYRSKARIPALSYLHWHNAATITRSSQPMVGLKQARSIQDEKLIEAIFASNVPTGPNGQIIYGSTAANLILDARPTANAIGQAVMGAGSENMENYKNCKKSYMGIDNIHVMRTSLNAMCEAMQSSDSIGGINKFGLAKSGWLKHIASLLEGSFAIVKNIHVYNSHVLVHCSDGWDRTSQLTTIAELCLDPYYRTFRGFQILIEKGWVSFGHKFAERCGHLSNEKYFVNASAANGAAAAALKDNLRNVYKYQSHARETSPVFHQFLDCVYQLLRQYPTRFEFNEKLLVELHYHVYSCQFGTFLFNCERERVENRPQERTWSVWDYVNSKRAEFVSGVYDPQKDKDFASDGGVLLPDARYVRYWAELFGRKDEEVNEVVVPASPQTNETMVLEVAETVDVQTGDPLGGTSGPVAVMAAADILNGTGVIVTAVDSISSPLTTVDDNGWETQPLQVNGLSTPSSNSSQATSKASTPLKTITSFLSSSTTSSTAVSTPAITPPASLTPSEAYASSYDVENVWREDKELGSIAPANNSFHSNSTMGPSSLNTAIARSNTLQDFSSSLRVSGLVDSFTRFTMNVGEVVYGRGRGASSPVDKELIVAVNGRGNSAESPLASPSEKIKELLTVNTESNGAGACTAVSVPIGSDPLSPIHRAMRSASASSDFSSSRSTSGGVDFPFPSSGLLKRNGSVSSLSQQIQQAQESRIVPPSSPLASPPRSNSINSISSTTSSNVAPLSSPLSSPLPLDSPSSLPPLGGEMVSSFISRPTSFKGVSLSSSPATSVPLLGSPVSGRDRMMETKAADLPNLPDPPIVEKSLPHPLYLG